MFTTRLYDGDCPHCYAVFRKADLPRGGGVVMPGEARPIVTGLGRREARATARRMNRERKERKP